MPLYEYLCEACGHRFETIRKFSDPPIEVCPKCGGTVNKLQSAPAFHLKGSGWYITDYARKDAPGEKGDTPPAPASQNEPAPAKSEVGSQKSEDKSQKAEVKVKRQKSEGKSDKAEGKSPKTEGKSEKSEGKS